MKIKYYHQEFETQKGGYILFNGVCYQFGTGNKRILGYDGYTAYKSINITKTMLKQIPLDKMKKIIKGKKEDRSELIYWIFE